MYGGSTYFLRIDAQANIIALLDNSGTVVVKYNYDAWGKCIVDSSTTNTTLANLNPFRYRSYYFDTETGLYFLKTRYYDPEIGRFMTIDDISYLDPENINGLNLYAYCLNNPITNSDPTGHSATLAIILGIIALTGFITTCIGVGTNNNIVTAIGLTMVAVPALITGGLALVSGITAGATLTAIIGGVTIVAGIGTGLFASAEYQEVFTGNNWILATTGMSEGLYNGLMITFATLAMLGTFASSFSHAFKINSIKEIGKLNGTDYKGIKFIQSTKNGNMYRSLEFHHGHLHKGHNLHWQLNKWSKTGIHYKGGTAWWSIFLKRLP